MAGLDKLDVDPSDTPFLDKADPELAEFLRNKGRRQPDDPGIEHERYVPYDHLHEDDAYVMIGLVGAGAISFVVGFTLGAFLF